MNSLVASSTGCKEIGDRDRDPSHGHGHYVRSNKQRVLLLITFNSLVASDAEQVRSKVVLPSVRRAELVRMRKEQKAIHWCEESLATRELYHHLYCLKQHFFRLVRFIA